MNFPVKAVIFDWAGTSLRYSRSISSAVASVPFAACQRDATPASAIKAVR